MERKKIIFFSPNFILDNNEILLIFFLVSTTTSWIACHFSYKETETKISDNFFSLIASKCQSWNCWPGFLIHLSRLVLGMRLAWGVRLYLRDIPIKSSFYSLKRWPDFSTSSHQWKDLLGLLPYSSLYFYDFFFQCQWVLRYISLDHPVAGKRKTEAWVSWTFALWQFICFVL